MPRQVQVTVPIERSVEVHEFLVNHPESFFVSSFTGDMHKLIIFRTKDKMTDYIIAELEQMGVGVLFGVIDIVALQGTKPRLAAPKHKRRYKVTDRLPLEEIYDTVDDQNHLTFNYVMFVVVAGIISCVGLATNSPEIVVASMLVSPLMGPIVAVTLGTVIREWPLVRKGLRNELIGVTLCLLIGFIWGLCTNQVEDFWAQQEQVARGTLTGIYTGIALAIPSGAGVALATTGGGMSALVGVAISAALLPPICNAGMYMAYSLALNLRGDDSWESAMVIGIYSFALFMVNFLLIYFVALVVFKIKKIKPGRTLHAKSHYHLSEDPRSPTTTGSSSVFSRLPTGEPIHDDEAPLLPGGVRSRGSINAEANSWGEANSMATLGNDDGSSVETNEYVSDGVRVVSPFQSLTRAQV